MGEDACVALASLFNEGARNRRFPPSWGEAEVVGIFKKGAPDVAENYRPISLLNVTYKIYAAILARRLHECIGHKLRATQFGFRHSRSTGDPIHLVRRLQDLTEPKQHSTLHLLFLDWSKAFDRLSPEAMLKDLSTLGVPPKSLGLLESLLKDPMFRTVMNDQKSDWFPQATGVRQGCTLSPLLFIASLTVVMEEVERELRTQVPAAYTPVFSFADV
eukprot:8962410-Alexandrium_andersonii.AAC.1